MKIDTPCARMKALHDSREFFVMPNAWDVPSARALADAGFPLIGTSSWAVAAMLGYPDGEQIPFDLLLTVAARICTSTDAMVSVDMEAGFAADPEGVAANVARVMAAGAVGINLEDSLKGGEKGLKDLAAQAERIRAIKALRNEDGDPVFLNARTDTFMQIADGRAALDETFRRAEAYAKAGADCLFVPFLRDEDIIRELASACPLPLNLLALKGVADLKRLSALGVTRLSLGNGLFDIAVARQQALAKDISTLETFDSLFE